MKITSEKFLKFYVVASFLLIVLLSIATVILVKGQNNLQSMIEASNTSSEISASSANVNSRLDSMSSSISEANEGIQDVWDKLDHLEGMHY